MGLCITVCHELVLLDGVPLYKVPSGMETLSIMECLVAKGYKEGSGMYASKHSLIIENIMYLHNRSFYSVSVTRADHMQEW